MDHTHLQPDEFDLLLDGDVGFGLTPLKLHVRQCDECRTELEERQAVLALLEELPDFAPPPLFGERVMSQIQLFEPWHVTLRDSVERLVPRSTPARALAGAAAFAATLVVSVIGLLLVTRLDAVVFGAELLADRGRSTLFGLVGGALTAVFGDGALGALASSGATGVLLGVGVLLGSLIAAVLLLRALTASYRRQRI